MAVDNRYEFRLLTTNAPACDEKQRTVPDTETRSSKGLIQSIAFNDSHVLLLLLLLHEVILPREREMQCEREREEVRNANRIQWKEGPNIW